jgi:hypothetical protein
MVVINIEHFILTIINYLKENKNMKNRVLLCLFVALCINSNSLATQLLPGLLYEPYPGGESTKLMTSVRNDTTYTIRINCYDGVPYSGAVYLDTLSSAIKSVSYWDSSVLVQNNIYSVRNHNRNVHFLMDITIADSVVSFKDAREVSMYIVDALTGDTVITHNFPKHAVTVQTMQIRGGHTPMELKIMENKYGAEAVASGKVEREIPLEISTYNYSLPQGIYFAYFIDIYDTTRALYWVEKIVKE